jgi:hypothetical protein
MNNRELEAYLSPYGVKVICADELPAFMKRRSQFYVVNTDPCGRRGKHWVAFYFSENICEFYDSLGQTPQHYHPRFEKVLLANGPRYGYIRDRIQALDSDVCGQYCIYFAVQCHLGRTMKDISRDFF